MGRASLAALITLTALVGWAADPGRAADSNTNSAEVTWDAAQVARMVNAARQARQQGDLMAAERLCYTAFQTVDQSALAAYDAYVDLLTTEHRAEEPTVRAQAARLHEVKAHQGGTEPTSTYLGFAPTDGLNAYADLLRTLEHPDEAQRMRSLALAYQQVQQAHFQRTMLYRQGKDPRGAC